MNYKTPVRGIVLRDIAQAGELSITKSADFYVRLSKTYTKKEFCNSYY